MSDCTCEPTLNDALSDPVILMMMAADHVDRRNLEAVLSDVARKVGVDSGDRAAAS